MKEFLRLDNRVRLILNIKPTSPLLINLSKELSEENGKSDNRNCFLTTESSSDTKIDTEKGEILFDERKGEIYIPGSTLKGLFRERFLDMFGQKDETEMLFGTLSKKSRIFIQDAYFSKEDLRKKFYTSQNYVKEFIKTRAITPLDSFSAKARVPLQFEYTKEIFSTEIVLYNASRKELQALYLIIRDSILGEIRIGNSKTRGFGKIEFEIEDLEYEHYRGKENILPKPSLYFERDEKRSKKIGDNYLSEYFVLKKEYKKIDMERINSFVIELFEGV